MLDQFLLYIKKNKLFKPKERILLAVSGGIDSVVMAELFHKAKFDFAIAHCNFQLRGKESDGDEKFVKGLAKKYGVRFYSERFNTERHAATYKVSIQMAARELRYLWFSEIIKEKKFKYVATAHHLNDSIETFFINLLRGTGIEGITGIKAKSQNIIRPLLFAERNEIEKFAKGNKITFREDSSNNTDDYLRNKIRHHLIPLLAELNPAFEQTMGKNLAHFAFAEAVVSGYIREKEKKLFNTHEKFPSIKLAEIKREEYPEQILFAILSKFNFSLKQCEEMLDEGETSSGKIFSNKQFRILRDRGKLLLNLNTKDNKEEHTINVKTKTITTNHGQLSVSLSSTNGKSRLPSSNGIQCMDASLLKFPLTMRAGRAGDYFYPLGMKHRKKLSDFFIDQKVNRYDKEKICVLTSENEIVCILGHRIDDRFKVTEKTKKIYKAEMRYY
jgi:tRNA(Ile)-lysidine synthase